MFAWAAVDASAGPKQSRRYAAPPLKQLDQCSKPSGHVRDLDNRSAEEPLASLDVHCVAKAKVELMRELEDEINLLELRSEQLLIHLRHVQRTSEDAARARCDLLDMLKRLAAAKGKRDLMLDELAG